MSRTPLSIVREAKDFLTNGNRRHSHGGGFRRFSSQPNLATVDLLPHSERDLAWLHKGPPPGVPHRKRLPSLSNVTQAGKRPPSPPRSSTITVDRHRSGSTPTLTPPGQQQPLRRPHSGGTESCFSAAADACRSPLSPLLGREDDRNAEHGCSAKKIHKDFPADFSPKASPPGSSRKPRTHASSHSQPSSPLSAQRPPKRKDELLVYRPNGDGQLPDWLLFPKPLEIDSDGDEAHEFWEENPITGALLQQISDATQLDELS